MILNLYELEDEMLEMGQIMDFLRNRYGILARHYQPENGSPEGLEDTILSTNQDVTNISSDGDFYQDSMAYFLSDGKHFAKYMRVVLGRDVSEVVGAKLKSLEEGTYFQLSSESDGCYIVKDSSTGWNERTDFFALQYGVSNSAMKQYLLMHEHAHASQSKLDLNEISLEKDVENIILKYTTAMSVTCKDRGQLYDEIASIASQRIEEVERHYGR